MIRLRTRTVVLGVAALAVGAALVVLSGVVPIAASSGHWAVTEWFLHFAMRRSVVTYSLGTKVPEDLEDPDRVLRGAGHYETGCRPCHGAPERPLPQVPRGMTPHPPDLGARVPTWEDEELFWIVRHGIKFTGMPAWPAPQRQDEVWDMVAFLRVFPELDFREYRELVLGATSAGARGAAAASPSATSPRPPRVVAERCVRCHGADGLGRGGAFPRLAGQRSRYLDYSLRAYATGERWSGIMMPVAGDLDEVSMHEAARYYAGLAPGAPSAARGDVDADALERGEAIAERGIPGKKVPSCVDCHGPGHEPRNPVYPLLAGQHAHYLALQLELFQEGRRGETAYEDLMHVFVERLTSEEIQAVSRFYATLPPTRRSRTAGP